MHSLTDCMPVCLATKEGLVQLKELLKDVKCEAKIDEKNKVLVHLVAKYLECPPKIPAKRVLSSFFQSLKDLSQSYVKTEICTQLGKILRSDTFEVESARHNVGTIAALMENFKLGEKCLSNIALPVITYLAEVGHKFYQEVHPDVPPVFLNEVMHHCHVTLQTLNLVLQKTVADDSNLSARFHEQTKLLQIMWNLDKGILTNEMFLLDCRCCCAMNAILILQLTVPSQDVFYQIPDILFPNNLDTTTFPACLVWLKETRLCFLDMEDLSLLSGLAVAFGYIAMVNPESVVQRLANGSYFYLHLFAPSLLKYSTRCTDTTSRTLFCKTISLYSTKLLECVQKTNPPPTFIQEIHGESPAMQSLLGYVWTHWEDQLDIVRQSAKVVFEKVLQLHCITKNGKTTTGNKDLNQDSFLQSLVRHLFSVTWTSRGKFSALIGCVRHLGCQPLLDMRPSLPVEVLQQLQEQTLSCYASELYYTMFASHLQELEFSEDSFQVHKLNVLTAKDKDLKSNAKTVTNKAQMSQAEFCSIWIEPVTKAMCEAKKKLKQKIVEYLLPRLMKSGDGILNHMVHGLSLRLKEVPQQAQGAIIMCLHRARTLGFLRPAVVTSERDSLWLGYLSTDVLKETLCSLDDQIRLDAFALVCENSKTSETITTFEFEMIKFFIPHNVNNQSPAFRQSVLALLKKLLFRLKESLLSLRRKSKGKNPEQLVSSAIDYYESFLKWLTISTAESLYPGAAFARRTTCLAILSMLTAFFTTDIDGYRLPKLLNEAHIQALLSEITDTFEENKRGAFGILSLFIEHQKPILDTQSTVETMSVAFSLACSTRPQDCATAVYLFKVLLKQQQFYPNHCDFLAQLPSATGTPELPHATTSGCPKLLLLWSLLKLFNSQIEVAKKSLISAAASRPMYPTLHCIRYILQDMDFGAMKKDHLASAKAFIKNLIISCLDLSRVVSPVVQNSSPEGNIPEEASAELDTPNEEWSRALVESMPEYLVVCGWRSIKEVSLTLGCLCLQLPTSLIVKDGQEHGLLSLDQVEVIGKYFNQQLLESIHRGAFELAYAGFQLLCQMLWSHPQSCFHQLPSQWLSAVIEDIKSGDHQSKLCATRRSAGVPFLVQAITSTEPNLTGRKMFHSAMKDLLQLALSQDENFDKNEMKPAYSSDAHVHALNILRALYRESRLGDDVVVYVADGLKAAILGFKSEQWAVRNSATLLLSSLMTRVFGVKRSKDEATVSKKNCQTGRAFFYRYPTLYPFLLSELEAATANVMSRDRLSLHPSLYPVLLVLGRLFPSTLEGSDSSLSLRAFIPYVIKCASSPVYKTRVIASRAIQPLAKRNELIDISLKLWENIPISAPSQTQSSHIHGCLLQLTQLIKLVEMFHETSKTEAVHSFVKNLELRKWIFEKINPCFATRQAGLLLTDAVLDVADTCHSKCQEKITTINILRCAFESAVSNQDTQYLASFLPFFFEYEKTRAQLCLKHLVACKTLQYSLNKDNAHYEDVSMQNRKNDFNESKALCPTILSTSEMSSSSKQVEADFKEVNHANNKVLLMLLNSPLYDVRLGVLDVLLSSVRSTGTNSQSDLSSPNHASPGPDELDSEHSSQAAIGAVYIQGAEAIVSDIYPQLLRMAIETESHHLCQEKVFYLLASLPEMASKLETESSSNLLQMLSTLTERIRAERRTEIKAAVLRFTVFLVAVLYKRTQEAHSRDSVEKTHELETNSSHTKSYQSKVSSFLIKWLMLLKESSSADENPALQISCCYCLLQNAEMLLVDPSNLFGGEVYTSWSALVVLLQDDDLEVKEIAASVVCALLKKEQGSYQPSYALHILPSVLLSLHGSKDPNGSLRCLITWTLYDNIVAIKGSDERLFDKGEMNTYFDHVAFTKSIMSCLNQVYNLGQNLQLPASSAQDTFSLHLNLESNSNIVFGQQIYSNSQSNAQLSSFLNSCFLDLLADLQTLRSKCQREDMFRNITRFETLCKTMHKSKLCRNLFCGLISCTGELATSLNSLDSLMKSIKKDLNVINIIC